MRQEYCESCNTGVNSLISIDTKAQSTSCWSFSFQLRCVTPADAAPHQHTVLYCVRANGLIIGLLSSSALVCAVRVILRVPADLLYLLPVSEDTDINTVSVIFLTAC